MKNTFKLQIILSVMLLLWAAWLNCCRAQLAPGVNTVVVHSTSKSPVYGYSNEDSMKGQVWLPSDWNSNPTRKYGFIFFCHGTGQAATSFTNYSAAVLDADGLPYDLVHGVSYENIVNPSNPSDVQSFVVLALQAWVGDSPDPGCFQQVYRWMNTNLGSRIDTNRVFLTGLSAGAGSTIEAVLIQDSIYKHWKGIVSFSPQVGWQNAFPAMDSVMLKRSGMRAWILAGNSDPAYNSSGVLGLRDTLNKHDPGKLDFSTFVGGHCCWIAHYNTNYIDPTLAVNVPQWMLKNSVGPAASPSGTKFLPIVTGSINFNWRGDSTYTVSFDAYDTDKDAYYEIKASPDYEHFKTVDIIKPHGSGHYSETFKL